MERNLRRRTAYGEMSSEQKIVLLERRRVQYAAKRQTTLKNPTAATSKESSSSLEPCNIILPQHTLYMRDKPIAFRNAAVAQHMALRSRIYLITTDTPDWTCEVQIADISLERKGPEKQMLFQNLLLEDEEGQQIRVAVYGDDIAYYADKLVLLNTYLISAARIPKQMVITFATLRNTQFLLTLWGGFSEIEGPELVKSNKSILSGRASTVLLGHASGSFPRHPPLIIDSDSHKLISIAEMTSQTSVGIFNVEATMSISDEF
ncbi:hypothetical protein T459_20451 [Capsicum annuum]|uniref:Replication protein A OB domain-containing protein n=1 Tax=Capsicum annuum TaxID=4072 RepID=A0A2G2Z4M6_CAPAN|nr:hypothetical protein T459_20451 [Capsicum annuum]